MLLCSATVGDSYSRSVVVPLPLLHTSHPSSSGGTNGVKMKSVELISSVETTRSGI